MGTFGRRYQTRRGRRARALIESYLEHASQENRTPPIREVAAAVGLAVSTTHRHMVILKAREKLPD